MCEREMTADRIIEWNSKSCCVGPALWDKDNNDDDQNN